MKRICWIVLAAGLACGRNHKAAAPTAPAVRVQTVESGAGQRSARYSATINANSRVDVAFKVGGYVARIAQVTGLDGRARLVQEGDRVAKGMELAALRKDDYAQKLDEANAALAEAIASYHQAKVDGERAARLFASQSISAAEADAAKAKADTAQARAEGARVRLEQARTAFGDTSLRAPMSGIVLERRVEIGTLASAGMVAVSIADIDTVKATFGVPDTVVHTLKMGTPQTVLLEAFRGQSFTGRISRIASAADSKSRIFEVEVEIGNPRHELKPGMVASLELSLDPDARPQVLLPLSAIVRAPSGGAEYAVFVVEGEAGKSSARIRPIKLGDLQGNRIAVREGLQRDDRVVVMGAPLLADGEAVQIIPEGEKHVARD
ncbi:MAG TPA: efflux RND transporter periplasmic adaptor subunit [Myxococcales bacterium]|nr:efflux RND transporter periplasmic adaptor subunit [Myxococcales bacterium]